LIEVKRRASAGSEDACMSKTRRLLLIQGHPDPEPARFCRALAAAYAEGGASAGHQVRQLDIARLDFPLLRHAQDWKTGRVPAALVPAQEAMAWADHWVLIYPLWMGEMPALLKGFLEQVLRPGFAADPDKGPLGAKPLAGRSARVVVTMGMPALAYRWYFRAHGLKALERNILGMVGISPIRATLVGSVEAPGAAGRTRWLGKLRALGAQGA
jgi:putative NADPH-quinone reductase